MPDQAGMATNLPQPQQRSQEMELLLRQFLLSLDLEQELLGGFELGSVKRFLLALNFTKQIFLDPIRQVLGHLRFGPAQQKGSDASRPASAGQRIAFGIVKSGKLSAAAEHARHGERHKTPEIEQPVLDWCSREDQPMIGFKRTRNLSGLGTWILDVLSLIQDERQPSHRSQAIAQQTELAVVE